MNPLDFAGPEFLAFYICALMVALALAAGLRWYLRQPGDEPDCEALNLSPYEVAYLSGGDDLACNTAIARLVHDNVLQADPAKREVRVCAGLPDGVSDIEYMVYDAAGPGDENAKRVFLFTGVTDAGQSVSAVRSSAKRVLEPIRSRLVATGLVVAPAQDLLARIWSSRIVVCVLVLGIVKLVIGLSRHRPVLFLFGMCVVTAFIAFFVYDLPVHRSRRGDRALAKLKQSNAALQYCLNRRNDFVSSQDFVLALGLFGIGVLAGTPLADLAKALSPPPNSGGGGSGGSCGGSSCGGGCGGGCGGCGS